MTHKVLLICLAFLLGGGAVAGASEKPVENELFAAFAHLEERIGAQAGAPEAEHLDTLLAFLEDSPASGTVWEESRKGRGTGVGVTFAVPASLSRFIRYMYDPDIPVSAVVPGVVRLVREAKGQGDDKGAYACLRAEKGGRKAPLVARSRYLMEITPDGNSGAYYGYDQDELTLLSSWHGRRFLLTASRQSDPSCVGKKGYPVTTRDGGTLYCYSGKKGLTKPGLGWVDSYIYTSLAITLYLEGAPEADSLKAVSYKWLNAGWMGKNMVRPHHIVAGIERFADHLARFLQSPNIPEPDGLAALARRLEAGGEAELQGVLGRQLEVLLEPGQKRAAMMGPGYVEGLDHEELVASILSTHVASLLAGGDPGLLEGLLDCCDGTRDDPLLTGCLAPSATQVPAGAGAAVN